MTLRKNNFGCCPGGNRVLFEVSWYMFYPTILCINLFARLLKPTTKEIHDRIENDPCYQFYCILAFCFPLLVILLLLTLPFAFIACLIWFPLQYCRQSYVYLEHKYSDPNLPIWKSSKKTFKIATANVCLLPEFATRANNLNAPNDRAGKIIERIIGKKAKEDIDNEVLDISINEDNISQNCSVPSDAKGLLAVDELASQRSLYSQLNNVRAMENPIVSLKDDQLEPADIRSKEFDSNMCLTSVNYSISALDYGSCDDRTENGSVAEGSFTGHMKVSMLGLEETSSIASSLAASTMNNIHNLNNHRNVNVQSALSAPDHANVVTKDIGDNASESATSFDTIDSVKNFANVPEMMSSAPAGFKIKDNVSEHGFDAVDNDTCGNKADTFIHSVDVSFPSDLDFLCLSEVFDRTAAKIVITKLQKHFNYIIYDIAERPCFVPCNSGLLLASKYPIADVQFHKYGAHEGSDSMACKGILLIKLKIGNLNDGTPIVGFISQTHIQARVSPQSNKFQSRQLDLAVEDIKLFHAKENDTKEIVCFDFLTGDLNFDSESDTDQTQWSHSLFTDLYVDPCRKSSGEDKSWTVGTELLQPFLYDEEVATPEHLRATLIDSETRSRFVASTQPKGNKESNGKRRIDYICYGREVDSRFTQDLRRFSFITALASLTDHVPLAATFDVLFDKNG